MRGLLCGLRGTGPALAGKLWRGSAFALCAMEGLIASNARSGPIPLRCGFMVLRGTGPALAGKLWGGSAFALCATEGLIASNARSGAVPRPLSSARAMGDLDLTVDMKRSCRDN